MTRLDELVKEIHELKTAKELLDEVLSYIGIYSGKIDARGETSLPREVMRKIEKYTKFDDSE